MRQGRYPSGKAQRQLWSILTKNERKSDAKGYQSFTAGTGPILPGLRGLYTQQQPGCGPNAPTYADHLKHYAGAGGRSCSEQRTGREHSYGCRAELRADCPVAVLTAAIHRGPGCRRGPTHRRFGVRVFNESVGMPSSPTRRHLQHEISDMQVFKQEVFKARIFSLTLPRLVTTLRLASLRARARR